jgi:hypothetical protein
VRRGSRRYRARQPRGLPAGAPPDQVAGTRALTLRSLVAADLTCAGCGEGERDRVLTDAVIGGEHGQRADGADPTAPVGAGGHPDVGFDLVGRKSFDPREMGVRDDRCQYVQDDQAGPRVDVPNLTDAAGLIAPAMSPRGRSNRRLGR